MSLRKLLVLFAAFAILSLISAQCVVAPTPEKVIEKVVETVVVTQKVEAALEESEVQELRVAPAFFAGTGYGGIGGGGDMAELDPVRRGTWSFHSLLWAPLVAGDTEGNVIPEKSLAESWDVSEDGTVYTFHLRPDAVYSDGTPITAQHVVDVFGYVAMMTHPQARGWRDNYGPGRRFFWDIVGFLDATQDENCPYEQFGVCEIEGVKALDDHTVEITLTAPSVSFIKRVQVSIAIFNPEDMLAGMEAEYDLLDFWTAHARSSGPYKINRFRSGEGYEMVPNELYFGPKPKISKINVLAVSDDINTILTAFANKELDMVPFSISGDAARQAMADPYMNSALAEIPTWIVEQFWMVPNPPLDDVHVRRAMVMAADRDALLKVLNAGADRPLHIRTKMHRSPAVPHCQEETAAVEPLPFDPEMAKAELEQSQYWPDVLDMEIHLLSQNPEDLAQIEALQKMLQDNLGLKKVTVHTEEVPDMMNPPFPLHMWYNTQQPWYADLTDTLNNMIFLMRDEPWKPDDPRPFVAVPYVAELAELNRQALAENDPDKRCELVAQIGQTWNDTAFSLDYGLQVGYYLIAPWVQENLQWYQNAGQGKPLNIEDWWIAKH